MPSSTCVAPVAPVAPTGMVPALGWAAVRCHVIQVDGSRLVEGSDLNALSEHLSRSPMRGSVIVHGGSREVDALHRALGIPFSRDGRLCATSALSMEVVAMTLCGLLNTRLVAHLVASGHRALGLTGVDFGLMRSRVINEAQLGRVGGPPRIVAEPLIDLLDRGLHIVVSPICLAEDGGLLNVRADVVAQSIAVALKADCLDFLVDVDAVTTPDGAVHRLSLVEVQRLVRESSVRRGVIPKLQAALAAIDGGVQRVRVGSIGSIGRGKATEVHH